MHALGGADLGGAEHDDEVGDRGAGRHEEERVGDRRGQVLGDREDEARQRDEADHRARAAHEEAVEG